ncbi:MAG: PVC-type heme-binding CxxCH protein [Pirellulales bacterium]
MRMRQWNGNDSPGSTSVRTRWHGPRLGWQGRWLTAFLLLVAAQAPGGEVSLDGHKFTLPDGFTIERAAGPPLVDRPITADFDEEGRLYISDSSGTNDKVDKQLAERPHRILRLEDRDGDGVFDHRTVFADQMMFPEGTLWYAGSLYVAAPPSIWKLTDTDNDGVADQRVEWFQGKTLTGCANDLHGPYLGLDGRIYWCKGAFAEQTYERSGGRPLVTKAAHIFRCRPDGSDFEHVMTGGMDNPVDVVFTPGGERIFTTTFLQNPGGGKRDGLIHAVYGGVYGKVHDVIERQRRTGDVLPPLSHLGPAAPCGLTRYRGREFGPGWEDNLFACLFNLHKVTRHVLTPSGATFTSHDEDFVVSSNIDFHPTDVLADADGSLLIVNTGGWYKLCCPTSQLWKPDILGAVYRVRRVGVQPPADPRGRQLAWDQLTPSALANLLHDTRPAVRERATQQLARRGEEAVSALTPLLQASSPATREAAVWAVARIDHAAARAATRQALADTDSTVRQAALHSVSLWRDAAAGAVLQQLAGADDAANARVAVEALGRIGDRSAVPRLWEVLAQLSQRTAGRASAADQAPRSTTSSTTTTGSAARPVPLPSLHDRFLDHAFVYALIELGDREASRAALASRHPYVVHAALLALDQMDDGGLTPQQVAPLLSSTEPVVRETATWLVSRHPEWGGALAGVLRGRLEGPALAEADRSELQRQLAQFARHADIQSLLAEVARQSTWNEGARLVALGAMRDAGLRETPAEWFAALARALGEPQPAIVAGAVATARGLNWPKQPPAELVEALARLGADAGQPPHVRLDALVALPAGLTAVSPDMWSFLTGQLSAENAVVLRTSSATVLSRARLTSAQLLALADVLRVAGPLEADRLLGAFEQSTDEQVGLALIQALLDSPALASLRLDAVKSRLVKYSGRVADRAEPLYAAMNVDAARQRARLEQLLGQLSSGDVRRGQAVFHSTKAACSSCHAMGYLGGRVGPDLTRIGGIRQERDLLEAIVYPNVSFVRSYEPVVVVTTRGKTYNGLVKKDSVDELVLAINATEEVRLTRDEIEEVRPSVVSVMPSGLDQQLTPQELADLIAFLKAAK